MLDGGSQHKLHTLRAELAHYLFVDSVSIQAVVAVIVIYGFFQRLFAGNIRLVGRAEHIQLIVLSGVCAGLEIDRRVQQRIPLIPNHIVGPVFDDIPHIVHVVGLGFLPRLVNIGQRGGGFQQGRSLLRRQVQFLHRHHDVLPNGVFVGVVQHHLRALAFQPVAEGVLLCRHLLIEGGVQFLSVHQRTSLSLVFSFLAGGGSGAFSLARID